MGVVRCLPLAVALVALVVLGPGPAAGTPPARVAQADHRIRTAAPGATVSLDGAWVASSKPLNLSMPGAVPGDLITDLQVAGHIGDPLFELNFQDARLWSDEQQWVYTKTFDARGLAGTGVGDAATQLLVFDGIKMGARVSLNGRELGTATNQFLRYVFPLDPAGAVLRPTGNELRVAFDAGLDLSGRFMPCTGGWDWAPVSNTFVNSSATGVASTFSRGIWKNVYLVSVPTGTAAITAVTPLTTYAGPYPYEPLEAGSHGDFRVNVTVHLWAPAGGAAGTLTVAGAWGESASVPADAPAGDSSAAVQLRATAAQVRLWWPNGVGAGTQDLYGVTATWAPAGSAAAGGGNATAARRIGFRVPALVTGNDTDPAVRANVTGDGSGTHGMFFRVNGAAIYARGANMIPMEELEGRMKAEAHAVLVRSAADAGMNMLRVWGGGIYYPDAFYDACDERGVLLYHDLQFAGNGHSAEGVANATLLAEVRHQVRRLSHHPAVIMYDGANEVIVMRNGSTAVYAAVVMTGVAREDATRIVWPASPAAGWLTGVSLLYGTPNGAPLVALVGRDPHIWDAGNERHGTYTAGVGDGFPTVCSDPWSQDPTYGADMPHAYLAPTPANSTGVWNRSTFTSEFGVTGMSSFESMSATLAPAHWGLHGGLPADACEDKIMVRKCAGPNPMAQRNWACDNVVWSMFGNALVNRTGEAAFRGQLFQCLVGQALTMKQNVEKRRQGLGLGALTWQLNEIWPTGGWGSLEYAAGGGALTRGQVVGGRWKPLHYLYKAALNADVLATCGYVGRHPGTYACYVRNDRASRPFAGTVTLSTVELMGNGTVVEWYHARVAVSAGPAAMVWFTPPGNALPNGNTTALLSRVADEAGATVSEHMVQLAAPQHLVAPRATLTARVVPQAHPDGTFDVVVRSDRVALFVTLTTLAQGRFSDNCFLLPATERTLQFVPFRAGTAREDLAALTASLRVEDHSMYM